MTTNTQELLDKEEREATEALQALQAQIQNPESTEESQPSAPQATVAEEKVEKPQVIPERKEVAVTDEDFNKQAEEFERVGLKIDKDKASDSKYLTSRLYTTAGISKKLSAEKKALQEEAERIRQENAQLKQQLQEKAVKSEVENPPIEEIDDDFEDEKKNILSKFDVPDGFIDEVAKIADKKAKSKTARVEKELAELKQRMESMAQGNESQRFWGNVFETAPEAREVFEKDELAFQAYLDQNHYGSITNGELYNTAIRKGDYRAVAQMVKDFKKEISPKQINNEIDGEEIPNSIKKQISPKPVANSPINSFEGRIYTPDEIDKLYQEATMGRIKQEDWQKIESDIHKAAMEGRIRYK